MHQRKGWFIFWFLALSLHICISPKTNLLIVKFKLNSASVNKVSVKKQLFWDTLINCVNSVRSLPKSPCSFVLSYPALPALWNCNYNPEQWFSGERSWKKKTFPGLFPQPPFKIGCWVGQLFLSQVFL